MARKQNKKKRGLCTLRFPYHKKIKRDKSLRDGPVENKYLGGRGKEVGKISKMLMHDK